MPSVPQNIDHMTELVTHLKTVDFSAVTRDQAIVYIATKCAGLTSAQVKVVIQNVLG